MTFQKLFVSDISWNCHKIKPALLAQPLIPQFNLRDMNKTRAAFIHSNSSHSVICSKTGSQGLVLIYTTVPLSLACGKKQKTFTLLQLRPWCLCGGVKIQFSCNEPLCCRIWLMSSRIHGFSGHFCHEGWTHYFVMHFMSARQLKQFICLTLMRQPFIDHYELWFIIFHLFPTISSLVWKDFANWKTWNLSPAMKVNNHSFYTDLEAITAIYSIGLFQCTVQTRWRERIAFKTWNCI